MASRKQRRRRAKERRHEYEYVYVDDTGQEVEPPPEEKPDRSRWRGRSDTNGEKASKSKPSTRKTRPLREVRPPSWNRSVRRALWFFPLFLAVLWFVDKHSSLASIVLLALGYSALFVPLTYIMDRTAYRTYLRRSGQQPSARR
jgi:hypothetical protein